MTTFSVAYRYLIAAALDVRNPSRALVDALNESLRETRHKLALKGPKPKTAKE